MALIQDIISFLTPSVLAEGQKLQDYLINTITEPIIMILLIGIFIIPLFWALLMGCITGGRKKNILKGDFWMINLGYLFTVIFILAYILIIYMIGK